MPRNLLSGFQMGYNMGLGGCLLARWYLAYSKIIKIGSFGTFMLIFPWYYGAVTFLFHPVFHWSNRHLSQNTIGSYARKSSDKIPYLLITLSRCSIKESIFAIPWRWQPLPLACTGAIVTAAPNPSMNASSKASEVAVPNCLEIYDWPQLRRAPNRIWSILTTHRGWF